MMAVSFTTVRILSSLLSSKTARSISTKHSLAKFDVSFSKLQSLHRLSAKASLLVRANTEPEAIVEICEKFGGPVASVDVFQGCSQLLVLVQLANQLDCSRIVESCHFSSTDDSAGWRRLPSRMLRLAERSAPQLPTATPSSDPSTGKNGEEFSSLCLGEQIDRFYETHQISASSIRLRYFLASLVEDLLRRVLPSAIVMPFGSSINGLGKQGCDLDLGVQLSDGKSERNGAAHSHQEENVLLSPFVFYGEDSAIPAGTEAELLFLASKLIQLFLPGANDTKALPKARTPIVKFSHELMKLNCDISFNSWDCYGMTEVLWSFGQLNARFCPLVFIARSWASNVGLANFKNFIITLLVSHFMQQRGLLPYLNHLIVYDQQRIIIDWSRLLSTASGQFSSSLLTSDLLCEYFLYYSQFDFEKRAISLKNSEKFEVKGHSHLYIENPFDGRVFLCCKRLFKDEVDVFQAECKAALQKIREGSFFHDLLAHKVK